MLLDSNSKVYYSQGNDVLPINSDLRDFFDIEILRSISSSSEIAHVFDNGTSTSSI